MPVEFVRGDLFESGCDALVNPTNCVGVMGAGLAKEFRRRFPKMYTAYSHACWCKAVKPGVPHFWREEQSGLLVVNFPTKDHWRKPSRLEWVEAGLAALPRLLAANGATSVAIPALGCGLGGLDWQAVRALILGVGWGELRVLAYEP